MHLCFRKGDEMFSKLLDPGCHFEIVVIAKGFFEDGPRQTCLS